MSEQTRKENQERIAALLAAAEECGRSAWVDTGERYALKHIGDGYSREQIFASDGTRWWRNPCLVLTIDVYNDNLVTAHYGLRHIPTLPQAAIEEAGLVALAPHELPGSLDVTETVIFDHTQRGVHDGRPKKEVYRYGPTG